MKEWFPFTSYDFYAHIASGLLLVAAADYAVGGEVLVSRANWSLPEIVFWTAVVYIAGQIVALPSAALLEHFVFNVLLHKPTAVQMAIAAPRRREAAARALFAPREYAPLSEAVRERIAKAVAKSLGVTKMPTDCEAIFTVAFGASTATVSPRLERFRDLYGFSRNVAFVCLVAACLLCVRLGNHGWSEPRTLWLLVGSLVIAVGMFARFVKFYSAFSREVLVVYLNSLTGKA